MSSERSRVWFVPPVGHAGIVEGLWRAARDGRLAHAFGFFGPRGVGKFHAARWFAAGLLCGAGDERPGVPCGSCGPCKRVAAGSHPDLFVLDPGALELETVRVQDVVRRQDSERPTVDDFLELKAAEGGFRVVLLRDFERANAHAQNALLKTLEEPGADVVLVVESSAPARIVGTVHSRVVDVRFERLSVDETRAVLADLGYDRETCETLGRWSHGAPGRAAREADLGAIALRALIARALNGEEPAVLLDALGDHPAEFPGKTAAAQARERARFFLELVLEVCSDLVRAAGGRPPEELAHGDLAETLRGSARERLAARSSRLRRAVDLCLEARQDVDMNLSPEAACERALLALGGVLEAAPR